VAVAAAAAAAAGGALEQEAAEALAPAAEALVLAAGPHDLRPPQADRRRFQAAGRDPPNVRAPVRIDQAPVRIGRAPALLPARVPPRVPRRAIGLAPVMSPEQADLHPDN
jgi:hypothetical protein